MKNPNPHRPAIFALVLFFMLSWTPAPFAARNTDVSASAPAKAHRDAAISEKIKRQSAIQKEALELYHALLLQRSGLNKQAFITAWTGYQHLKDEGKLSNTEVLTICDYSQSSRKKRLYILDVAHRKLLLHTYVAHGRNSGREYATDFSNKPSSYKSSLGFFVTGNIYRGEHGPALSIDGLDKGFNDRASDRRIVIHGADYVGAGYLRSNSILGRSLGCPAVPRKETSRIIQKISDGSCFFIYHPSANYMRMSTVLNG